MPQVDIFEETTFFHRGIALKAHPNRHNRIKHLFEDHYHRLNPHRDPTDKKYIYLSWEYVAWRNEDTVWEILIALNVCSFAKDGHFEVALKDGRILNPVILDQQTYLTGLRYVTPFVTYFAPRNVPFDVLKH